MAALVLLVPDVAAMVTRLHDRDHSAWWLLWNVLPGIGWLVLVVTLGFLGSDARPHRYGPPPDHAGTGPTAHRWSRPAAAPPAGVRWSFTTPGAPAGPPRTVAGPCACRSR
ncbi:DUF805 domain-containing protein [Blastococcus saxobsidens]|uniref:DUF805 domain-containing protein n=1 Tax=Blastococcus saxobsidens TaxID=138336 RepID=UPI000CEC3E34